LPWLDSLAPTAGAFHGDLRRVGGTRAQLERDNDNSAWRILSRKFVDP